MPAGGHTCSGGKPFILRRA